MTRLTRFEVLLALQAVAVLGLGGGLYYYVSHRDTAGQDAPAVDPDASVVGEPGLDEELSFDWVPLERMEYLIGPWAARDGDALVSVAASGSQEAHGFTLGPWRLAIERPGEPFAVCGVYSKLQWGESLAEPWRVAYCQGFGPDPGVVQPTQVGLFRAPGREFVRLKVGAYLDVEIAQVQ